MTGGKEVLYYEVLNVFCKDAKKRLPLLQNENEDLSLLVTNIHALKSASASIGAEKISSLAAQLEDAGREKDMIFLKEKLPVFADELIQLKKNIKIALEKKTVI
jgi:HPt (histidine-containing phosphotransfer) domain-containing protein